MGVALATVDCHRQRSQFLAFPLIGGVAPCSLVVGIDDGGIHLDPAAILLVNRRVCVDGSLVGDVGLVFGQDDGVGGDALVEHPLADGVAVVGGLAVGAIHPPAALLEVAVENIAVELETVQETRLGIEGVVSDNLADIDFVTLIKQEIVVGIEVVVNSSVDTSTDDRINIVRSGSSHNTIVDAVEHDTILSCFGRGCPTILFTHNTTNICAI